MVVKLAMSEESRFQSGLPRAFGTRKRRGGADNVTRRWAGAPISITAQVLRWGLRTRQQRLPSRSHNRCQYGADKSYDLCPCITDVNESRPAQTGQESGPVSCGERMSIALAPSHSSMPSCTIHGLYNTAELSPWRGCENSLVGCVGCVRKKITERPATCELAHGLLAKRTRLRSNRRHAFILAAIVTMMQLV